MADIGLQMFAVQTFLVLFICAYRYDFHEVQWNNIFAKLYEYFSKKLEFLVISYKACVQYLGSYVKW